jgi:tetratricopeptide (TPR) repeat protein
MNNSADFDFIDDEHGGRFVPVGGPIVTLRQLVVKGDVDGAVKLYEESGGLAREELITEAQTASFETRKAIAQVFRRARDFASAGRVYAAGKLDADAAACFEQAGDFANAAGSWVRIGEVMKAAACFERAGKTEAALELYRQAGAHEAVAECLARAHRFLEASQAFRALKNAHAEVEVLRAGLHNEPSSAPLATRLAELMLQFGKKNEAVTLMMETAKRSATAKDDPALLHMLASSLEATGNKPAAEKIRARLKKLPAAEAPVLEATVEVAAAEPGADAYGFLKALPMFADLSLADMKALYRICTLLQFAPGQHLIETGQAGKGLFVIVDGQVEVFGGPDAGSRLLNTLGVGGYVGEISLVQDGPTSARVTARTPVKALFISRNAFHQYLYGAPQAALCIYKLFTLNLAERVRALSAAK